MDQIGVGMILMATIRISINEAESDVKAENIDDVVDSIRILQFSFIPTKHGIRVFWFIFARVCEELHCFAEIYTFEVGVFGEKGQNVGAKKVSCFKEEREISEDLSTSVAALNRISGEQNSSDYFYFWFILSVSKVSLAY